MAGAGPTRRGALAIGLALLLVASGCSALLEPEDGGELVWHTPRPALDSPTATPTPVPSFDRRELLDHHATSLRGASYGMTVEVTARRNGTLVGTTSVRLDREPGRVAYRRTIEGQPPVTLGGRIYLGVILDRHEIYGEDTAAYYRIVGENFTDIVRIRDRSTTGQPPVSADEVRVPRATMADRLYVLLSAMEIPASRAGPPTGTFTLLLSEDDFKRPVSIGEVTVLEVSSFQLVVRDGVIRQYSLEYVADYRGVRYTIAEEGTFEQPASFGPRPDWVPGGTTTPDGGTPNGTDTGGR